MSEWSSLFKEENQNCIAYKKESKLKSRVLITKNTTTLSLYSVVTIVGILERITKSNYKGGEKMAKNKNNQFKNNKNAVSKADVEFAGENGLEKIALRAQKKSK